MDKKVVDIQIRYAHFCSNSNLLGPGQRFVLWVQGCKKACKGCVAKSMRALDGGVSVGVERMIEEILITDDINGITISGGEPFLQAEALYVLVSTVKALRPEMDVIIYTGYEYEKLIENGDYYVRKLLDEVDILIDGEYVEELNDDIAYRGSSNQRIICFKDKQEYSEYYNGTKRQSEIQVQGLRIYLIGVPSKEMLKAWIALIGGDK